MTATGDPAAPVHISTYGRAVVRGSRTVLLIHGAGMDQSVWTLQGRHLAFHGWNALAVDLPGHGRARAAQPLPSVAAMADWLGAVAAGLEVGPLALVGHSLGALVALELAARPAVPVAALALFGAAAAMPVHEALRDAADHHDPKAVDLICDWGFGPRGHVGGSAVPGNWLMGHAQNLLRRGDPAVLAADLTACAAYGAGEARARAIRCPTLVVIGEEDRMTPPRSGRALAGLIADARLATIPRCGHMIMLEAPEESLAALKGFLD